jgi:6-phosphogluconolactonase
VTHRTVFPNPDVLAAHAAAHIARRADQAIGSRGRFIAVLAGGDTPRATYRLLADPREGAPIDWSRVELLWSDERCVPPDDPRSNFRMADETILRRVAIPEENLHRIRGEAPPIEAAAEYAREIAELLGPHGLIDLVLLGLGEDGHTASLFPGDAASVESVRWAVAVPTADREPWRVTMTLPALSRSREVLFLVSGKRKRSALQRLERGEDLPGGRVHPADGRVLWFVDREAAP